VGVEVLAGLRCGSGGVGGGRLRGRGDAGASGEWWWGEVGHGGWWWVGAYPPLLISIKPFRCSRCYSGHRVIDSGVRRCTVGHFEKICWIVMLLLLQKASSCGQSVPQN
jgi:hypothetical protein